MVWWLHNDYYKPKRQCLSTLMSTVGRGLAGAETWNGPQRYTGTDNQRVFEMKTKSNVTDMSPKSMAKKLTYAEQSYCESGG